MPRHAKEDFALALAGIGTGGANSRLASETFARDLFDSVDGVEGRLATEDFVTAAAAYEPPAPVEVPDFVDDFNRADSAAIGNGWVPVNTTTSFGISNNELAWSSTATFSTFATAPVTTDTEDQWAEVEVTALGDSNNTRPAPALRLSRVNNTAVNGYVPEMNAAGTSIYWVKRSSTGGVVVGAAATITAPTLPYRLRGEVTGAGNLRALINDVEVLTAVDPSPITGLRGLGVNMRKNARVDNFKGGDYVPSGAPAADPEIPVPAPDDPPPLLAFIDYDSAAVTATQTTAYNAELGVSQTWDPEATWQESQVPKSPGDAGTSRPQRFVVVGGADVPGSGTYKPTGRALRVELRPYSATNPGTSTPADGDVTNTGGYLAGRTEGYHRHASPGSTPHSQWPDPPGTERWYGFSWMAPVGTVFGDDYLPDGSRVAGTQWMLNTQFKTRDGGQPPLALEMNRRNLRLGGTLGQGTTIGPIVPGTWHRYEVGIFISANPAVGWVEVWRDGVNVIPRRSQATTQTVNGVEQSIHLKQGIYRSFWPVTHVFYFGPTKIGISRSAVLP